ncbi:hypothetical protein MMC20_006970 [Loxospora ochrophaea]|nr:hypothetical protein [Loxospora ochrophaea]
MAKTTKLKRNSKATSLRSRAARRETSPSINLDKSTINPKASDSRQKHVPSALSVHRAAGITKRKAKGKPLKRQQRLRQEKGLGRAETNLDKIEKKREKSIHKGKKVKERGSAWEDLNNKLEDRKKPAVHISDGDVSTAKDHLDEGEIDIVDGVDSSALPLNERGIDVEVEAAKPSNQIEEVDEIL